MFSVVKAFLFLLCLSLSNASVLQTATQKDKGQPRLMRHEATGMASQSPDVVIASQSPDDEMASQPPDDVPQVLSLGPSMCPLTTCLQYDEASGGCTDNPFTVAGNALTVGFAVKLKDAHRLQIVRADDKSVHGGSRVYFKHGKLVFAVKGNKPAWKAFSSPFTAGVPYKVTLTYNADSRLVKLFVGDVLVEKKAFKKAVALNCGSAMLGCSNAKGKVLKGAIQDFYMIGGIPHMYDIQNQIGLNSLQAKQGRQEIRLNSLQAKQGQEGMSDKRASDYSRRMSSSGDEDTADEDTGHGGSDDDGEEKREAQIASVVSQVFLKAGMFAAELAGEDSAGGSRVGRMRGESGGSYDDDGPPPAPENSDEDEEDDPDEEQEDSSEEDEEDDPDEEREERSDEDQDRGDRDDDEDRGDRDDEDEDEDEDEDRDEDDLAGQPLQNAGDASGAGKAGDAGNAGAAGVSVLRKRKKHARNSTKRSGSKQRRAQAPAVAKNSQ